MIYLLGFYFIFGINPYYNWALAQLNIKPSTKNHQPSTNNH
jgi:hypothetical protein